MLKYLKDNDLLSKSQFGFSADKSTHQALFNFTKHIYGSLNNNNKIVGCIYLDIAKAFNCINHKVLYYKMYKNALNLNIIKTKALIFGNRNKILKIGIPDPLTLHGKKLFFFVKKV